MSLSWWVIAIVDAAIRRSLYLDKPSTGHDVWLDARFRTQAEGAKLVRERE